MEKRGKQLPVLGHSKSDLDLRHPLPKIYLTMDSLSLRSTLQKKVTSRSAI